MKFTKFDKSLLEINLDKVYTTNKIDNSMERYINQYFARTAHVPDYCPDYTIIPLDKWYMFYVGKNGEYYSSIFEILKQLRFFYKISLDELAWKCDY